VTSCSAAGLRLQDAIPLLFPLFWVVVCVVIAYASGWQQLAATCRAQQPFDGKRWAFQSGRMRWGMGYNNCLTVGADQVGLYLSLLVLFRAGHPPLFIRWEEMTVGQTAFLFMRSCRIEFRSAPGVPLMISARLAEKLKAEAGAAWPLERIEPV
jgi:hypothetical protein